MLFAEIIEMYSSNWEVVFVSFIFARTRLNFNYKKILNKISNENIHPISMTEKKQLQNCLYEMMIDLDTRFRKHGITIFLEGGSLLGAKRHGGFIPWDDDVDFAVSRDGYEKIKKIFNEECADNYELRVPNSAHPNGNRFMQIYKKGTVLKTMGAGNPYQPQNVYIDIFPCDYVPSNRIHRLVKGHWSNLLMLIASCVMSEKYGDSKSLYRLTDDGKLYIALRTLIGKVFSFLSTEKWFDMVDNAIQYKKKSSIVTFAPDSRHYFGEMFPAKKVFPLTKIKFREHMFYAPANVEYYLKNVYGADYMVPPPEEDRESHFITELRIH